MVTAPTPAEIARLRALVAKATPAPWRVADADQSEPLIISDSGPVIHYAPGDYDNEARWLSKAEDDELLVAAVNALPGLLDAVERLAIAKEALATWERTPFPHLVNLLADDETENCAAVDFDRKRGDETERWILTAQKAEGKTPLDRVVELEKALATAEARIAKLEGVIECGKVSVEINEALGAKAAESLQRLATAEAERLLLARAIRGGNAHLSPTINELAARIVAEADR